MRGVWLLGLTIVCGGCREARRAAPVGDSIAIAPVGDSIAITPVRDSIATPGMSPACSPSDSLSKDLHNTLAAFRKADCTLTTVEPEDSFPISGAFTLFVLHAVGSSRNRAERHGIFIVDRASDQPILTLDVLGSLRYLDYTLRIEWADSTTALVCGAGSSYGDDPRRIRYRYDMQAARMLESASAPELSVVDFVTWHDTLYAFLSPRGVYTSRRMIAVAHVPLAALDLPGSSVAVDSIVQARTLPIAGIDSSGARLVLQGDSGNLVRAADEWRFERAPPTADSVTALGLRFLGAGAPRSMLRRALLFPERGFGGRPQYLVWDKAIPVYERSDTGAGIYRLDADGPHFLPFRDVDYDAFARYRPNRVRDGYDREDTELDGTIGPIAVLPGAAWFGTAFYDGEGHSGVGAVVSFSPGPDTYRVWYPHALVDWSTSAILVEGDTVWLGLTNRGEGAASSGGLLGFHPSTESVTQYAVPDEINRIRRVGRVLLLATSSGLYALDGGKVIHLVFDETKSGRGLTLRRVQADSTRRCP